MASIFSHFSIPGSTSVSTCTGIIGNSKWFAFKLFNPFISIKIIGFPIIFLFCILCFSYLIRLNLLRKTPTYLLLNLIKNHFKEVHPNLKWIKTPTSNEYKPYSLLTILFITLALINLGGMVYGTWCITTWFTATIGLALFIWLLTLGVRTWNYLYLFSRKVKLYEGEELMALAGFFPSGTPLWLAPLMVIIEIISWMIRPLSMGLRIAGNLVAGHVILGILGVAFLELIKTLSPSHSIFLIIANIPMNVITCLAYTTILYFECAVAIIQAYVLTLLTSTFLKEVEEMH